MFDPARPCDSFNKKKNRYTKKELDDLRYTYNIILPKEKMTISQICNFYKTLDWEKLKKTREMEKKKHVAMLKKKYMIKKAELKLKKKKEEEEKALEQEKKEEKEKFQKSCIARSESSLRDYQKRVVGYFGTHNRLLVYHKMGTGKTLTAVAASQCFLDANPTRKVIVITPASLTDNFKKTMMQYHYIKYPNQYEFYSIQKATSLLKQNKLNCTENLVIIDEVHNYKSQIKFIKGKLTSGKNIFEGLKCFLKANKLLLLTGTPLYNRPEDLNLYKVLLNYNESDMKNASQKEIFEHYSKMDIDTLKCKISFHDYQKDDCDFPKRIDVMKKIAMKPAYEKQYKKILNEIEELKMGQTGEKKLLGKVFAKLTKNNANQFENLTRRLTQNIDNNLKLNAKLDSILKYIQKLSIANKKLPDKDKHKIVIYSQFKEHGIYLIMQQTKVPFGVISGNTKVSDRQKIVNDYNSGTLNVLFITKAGGEGLDLKKTDAIILMEPTWNQNNSEQIIARAIRYKSHADCPVNRKQVRIIHLIHTYSEDMKGETQKRVKTYLEKAVQKVPSMPHFLESEDYKMTIYQKAKQHVLHFWEKQLQDLSIEKNKC